ncbi:MAG: glycosyltransferase family 4 protein [Bacteroidales bacterium]|nr:glycosyltransferase family 4 protein [Bacteroidales bacterium]
MIRNKKKIIRSVTVPQSISFFEEIMMRLKDDGYEVIVVTSPGKELDDFNHRHPQEKTIEVPMERHISFTKDVKSLCQMIKVMRNEKPYMVHSMTPKAGLLSMIAAWLTGVPMRIHTFTGLVWPTSTGIKRRILMATDWLTCACATHVIPEGQGVLDDLKNHGICKKPMRVLGYGNVMGVDMERFNPTRFADVKKDENVFRYLFVGRIVGDKGINELVEAFVRLNKEYPETRLALVGESEANLDPVKSEIVRLMETTSSIDLCGPKYGDNLLKEYLKSDCFVMPSYREGFPNTVMEAGAMGLPSIVTDINGSREIIINGENGLIVPSKNADALYKAMKIMLINTSIREEMATNARPLINNRFEKSFVQKCLISFYDDILKLR